MLSVGRKRYQLLASSAHELPKTTPEVTLVNTNFVFKMLVTGTSVQIDYNLAKVVYKLYYFKKAVREKLCWFCLLQ